MSSLTLDEILGVMDDAALEEKGSAYKVATIMERDSIIEKVTLAKEFIEDTTYASFTHEESLKNRLLEIDLVLLEVRLIEAIKDLSIIKQIRTQRPQMPILVVSQNDDPEFICSVYEAGATDFLTPSVDVRILYSKINNFLRISKVLGLVEFKNEEVVNTMKSLRKLHSAAKQEKVSRILAETERDFAEEAAKINKQMKEILDNLKEAFFFVGRDLTIGESTSEACKDIFGDDISGNPVGHSLNFKDPKLEDILKMGMEQVFDDFLPESVTLSMLPKIVETKSGKILEMTYTAVRSRDKIDKLIVVASDITRAVEEKRVLETKFRENRCIINILRHIDAFKDFVSDFKSKLDLLLSESNSELFKQVLHTLKGNSLVFELTELGALIHQSESALEQDPSMNPASLIKPIENQLHQFLDRHQDLLDIEFDQELVKTFVLDESDFKLLDDYFQRQNLESQNLWHEIHERVKHKHLGELCGHFEPTIKRLSEKENKKISFRIYGEELKLDIDPIRPLFKSMIHLISNACDHGIETPYTRLDLGKPEEGRVILRFKLLDDSLYIRLVDDGKGIDWRKLIDSAKIKGFSERLEREKINSKNAYEILFWDGFSTSDIVTQTSGRGVGMSAIRTEVLKLGGHININSKLGIGTKTEIIIPLQSINSMAA